NAVVKPDTDKYASLNYFLNTIDTMQIKMWCAYIDICVDLLLVKDLILQESKVYAANEYKKELKSIQDYLSIEYDMSLIHLPYGQRVISSLLLYAFTDVNRKSDYILNSSENTIKNFSYKVKKLSKAYNLNVNNMFHIIMDESMNQSIKTDAGSSYESRVAQSIAPLVQKLNGHSHDSKIPSVEYDNTFIYNNKLCGISAKRTLRERYKQNLEDVDLLDVDYMFLITLGTDLNEEKLNNIMQKKGTYVIVSQEEYDTMAFLNKSSRVISSRNIQTAFKNIIK
ncbi:MAG: hypothetical protein J6T74_07550, partial [Clostridia bacterium]|nr:hypothetical protein [Clostridia bacterium]